MSELRAEAISDQSLGGHFAVLDDPRDGTKRRHLLIDMIVIAIDGKTLRRSHDCAKGLSALHLVSAWASTNQVVLWQVAAEAQSNLFETVERSHGRVEMRRYRTLTDLSGVSRHPLWKGRNMIGTVESTREVNGKRAAQTRHFIGSIGPDARSFAGAVREHRGIEKRTRAKAASETPNIRKA